ncbi:GDSL-type esterase/lipase family protein [Mucilaginibacter rubeus]|nr:GDSL-type esterase/lipase family protein [Mucilaginibacter rubeus]
MRKGLIISIVVNILCLPLAGIYLVRKIQFYNSLAPKPISIKNENIFWKIRSSEFRTFEVDSNSIVFIGDSHTQFFEVAEAFHNAHCKNRGIALDGTKSVLDRIDFIVDKHPKKIFIQVGINDLLNGASPNSVSEEIREVIKKTKAVSPNTAIYLQSVFPTNWNKYQAKTPVLSDIKSLNLKLKTLAFETKCEYIDLYNAFLKGSGLNSLYDCGDSLHLNGLGYLLWRDSLKRYVN